VTVQATWQSSRIAVQVAAVFMLGTEDKFVSETTTLIRATGEKELALIRGSGYRASPTRLIGQPIFYPVLCSEYALQIARDWNARKGNTGYVTRFEVRTDFLNRYEVHTVGGSLHKGYWIPAEELDESNGNTVGRIEVIAEFRDPDSGQSTQSTLQTSVGGETC
jgi:hypothetical protein